MRSDPNHSRKVESTTQRGGAGLSRTDTRASASTLSHALTASSTVSIAASFDGTHCKIGTRPKPHPSPGVAVIRPQRVLLGSIERRITTGVISYTGVLGRDALCIVDALHPDDTASGIQPGDRVVVDAMIPCGTCELCKGGLAYICESRTSPGLHGAPGLLASHAALPLRTLAKVPATLDDQSALFAQSVASATHTVNIAMRDLRLTPTTYITILGDGLLALLVAQIASIRSPLVRLLGKHPERFTRCEKYGIKHRHISEVGKRSDQSIVIDCTGDLGSESLPLAATLIKPRGRVVLKGLPANLPGSSLRMHHWLYERSDPSKGDSSFRCPMQTLASKEAQVIGTGAGFAREGLAFLMQHPLQLNGLIGRSYNFETENAVETALTELHDRCSIVHELRLNNLGAP